MNFRRSYRSRWYKLTVGSRRARASVRLAKGDIVSNLKPAEKKWRTGRRGLGEGQKTWLMNMNEASNSNSSQFPLLRKEGRKTMGRHGFHTVWLHGQTCWRTRAQTTDMPRCAFSEDRRGPYVGEGVKKSGRADISVESSLVFQFIKGEGAFLKG